MNRRKKTILIIDDDHSHLTAAREILEGEGYTVCTHDQPFGSTVLARELKPDLVLLDVNMPGLPGDKLATILSSNFNTYKVPIVFYSSNDEDSLRNAVAQSRYRLSRVRGYICKGDAYDLKKKVALYLGEAQKEVP